MNDGENEEPGDEGNEAEGKSADAGSIEYSVGTGSIERSSAENGSAEEEEVAAVASRTKVSQESVLGRDGRSPTDLKRLKWEEVDLLFLNTDQGFPLSVPQTFLPQSSYINGGVYLDFSFVKGHINKREYDYFSEKYRLFFHAYQSKLKYLKSLTDDNHIFKATLEDHRKIEKWFESMPETVDVIGEAPSGGMDKQELQDIRQERLNAIAYRLVLNGLSQKVDKWGKEVDRLTNDRAFLVQEIDRYAGEMSVTAEPRKRVASLALDVCAAEEELAEIHGKIKAIQDFTQGFVARNEVLETRLNNLETKHLQENKELMDLRFDIDRSLKARNELKAKSLEQDKSLEDMFEQKQAFARQFQKLQFDSSKETRKSKIVSKQMDATNVEKQLWDVRILRLKERMEKGQAKKNELNKAIETSAQEWKATEKEVIRKRGMLDRLGNEVRLLEKSIATMQADNEAEKTKINYLKESSKSTKDPAAMANERRKIERDIDYLRREIIHSSRLHTLERQEYVKIYGEIKQMQQSQWSLRKVYHDNISKIRKARLEQMHQGDNIQKLSAEIEKQKNNIKWVKQQKVAEEKLLARKNAELSVVMLDYRNERLEKSKDLQERTLKLQSINEWKEINRVGDSEEEELKSLKMQVLAKREDLQRKSDAIRDLIKQSSDTCRSTKDELSRARIEYQARQIRIVKLKFDLYKKQLENEGAIQRFVEAAAERNHKSMRLNDTLREHVCYTEHISTAEEMIRRADGELVTRTDVITRLASIRKMELLGIDTLRQKMNTWRGLLDALEDISRRFEEITLKQIKLQERFDGSRHRMVREKQKEDPKEVQMKLTLLEDRVRAKEEKLMELKLLNFQSNRLLQQLQRNREENTESAQASSSLLTDAARKSDGLRRKIKQMTVEVSMRKSVADSLRRECEEAKKRCREAAERLERGEPPTPEIEMLWLRTCNGSGLVGASEPAPTDDLVRAVALAGC